MTWRGMPWHGSATDQTAAFAAVGSISRLLVLVVLMFGVVGCTGSPQPAPSSTSAVNFRESATPSNSPASSSMASQSASDAMTCVPPTDDVMAWLKNPFPSLSEADVSMVYVGAGNTPGDSWWVVAVWWKEEDSRQVRSFLTTAPHPDGPTGSKWIPLDGLTGSWSGTSWTGERLAAGKAAQEKAFSCLPSRYSEP